jgi:hypothetical protein
MGLSEFNDSPSMIILHFGSYIGNGHLRSEISLISHRRRPFSYLLMIANSCVLVKALSWKTFLTISWIFGSFFLLW